MRDRIEALLHSAQVRHVAYRVEHTLERCNVKVVDRTEPTFGVNVRRVTDGVKSFLRAPRIKRVFSGNQSSNA